LPILAQKLSRIGDWGGSNLDANSLQSGSVLDAIQHQIEQRRLIAPLFSIVLLLDDRSTRSPPPTVV
jgi:hypothetical protein